MRSQSDHSHGRARVGRMAAGWQHQCGVTFSVSLPHHLTSQQAVSCSAVRMWCARSSPWKASASSVAGFFTRGSATRLGAVAARQEVSTAATKTDTRQEPGMQARQPCPGRMRHGQREGTGVGNCVIMLQAQPTSRGHLQDHVALADQLLSSCVELHRVLHVGRPVGGAQSSTRLGARGAGNEQGCTCSACTARIGQQLWAGPSSSWMRYAQHDGELCVASISRTSNAVNTQQTPECRMK